MRVGLAEAGDQTESAISPRREVPIGRHSRVRAIEEWVVEQVDCIEAKLEVCFAPDVERLVEARVELRVTRSTKLIAAGIGYHWRGRRLSRFCERRRVEPWFAARDRARRRIVRVGTGVPALLLIRRSQLESCLNWRSELYEPLCTIAKTTNWLDFLK